MRKPMKNHQLNEKHLFALHHTDLIEEIGSASVGKEVIIADPDLAHRVVSILRLSVGESFILFDRNIHATVSLSGSVKNKLVKVILSEKNKNSRALPEIIFLLPLLKKEALETALYSLTEMGITTIQLIDTQKSQQRWGQKEFERAQKIIIAAAEQSKNFCYPQLHAPQSISSSLDKLPRESKKLFFDPAGVHIALPLAELKNAKLPIILAIGPEGDLTAQEKELLKQTGFTFSALTPTILRACQAAALAAGILRSYLR